MGGWGLTAIVVLAGEEKVVGETDASPRGHRIRINGVSVGRGKLKPLNKMVVCCCIQSWLGNKVRSTAGPMALGPWP